MERFKFKHITFVILALKLVFIGWLVWEFFHSNQQQTFTFDKEFLLFCLAGFIAQLIDGTLGLSLIHIWRRDSITLDLSLICFPGGGPGCSIDEVGR